MAKQNHLSRILSLPLKKREKDAAAARPYKRLELARLPGADAYAIDSLGNSVVILLEVMLFGTGKTKSGVGRCRRIRAGEVG